MQLASVKIELESPVPVHNKLLVKNMTGFKSILRINSREEASVTDVNVTFYR